jgi:NAD+ synthase
VLGISGGKDSTVVAMLAKKVWGNNVVGVLMPNGAQKDISDSFAIVNTLNIDYRVCDISAAYNAITALTTPSDKACTNIPPRLRMTVLYAIAQTLGYRVIGTGNASEAYVGWTTKWGDSAYDFNPIANLTCTEVMEVGKALAAEFGLPEKYVVKTPSDGLSGKSDEDNFGFTYDTLDFYIRGGGINADIAEKIDQMHKITEHKRNMPVVPEV